MTKRASVGTRQTMIFLVLLLPGLCRLSSCLTYQYHFVNMSKNWTEARNYCRKNYTDLVTIGNAEEMSRVMNTVNLTGYTGPVWIGLEKGNSGKWQWSLEDRHLYSDGQTPFSNWDIGQPDNSAGNQNCVGMIYNGKWHNVLCDSQGPIGFFVCYEGRGQTNQRYIFINQNMNWMEAQRYCREKHTDLVSVRNETENDLIQNMFGHANWVWIGLYKDFWQWSDQRNSSFHYWAPGRPDINYDGNQKCAVASLTQTDKGRWVDRQCGEDHPFLCYVVQPLVTGKRTVVKVKLRSAGNLRDPDVSDHVLQQLREELLGRAMPEGTQLRWRTQPDGQIFHLSEEENSGHEETCDIT